MDRMVLLFFFATLLNSFKAASQLHLKPVPDSAGALVNLRVLPQNFYNKTLGFVCKKEFQLQKKTGLPLYLRLGSKEEVDRLEGKQQKRPLNH